MVLVALGCCAALSIHKQLLAVRKISEPPYREGTTGPTECSADGESPSNLDMSGTVLILADIKLNTLAMLVPNVNRDIGFAYGTQSRDYLQLTKFGFSGQSG